MTSREVTAPLRPARATVAPWIGLLLPAASFFSHLQVGYVLIPLACTQRNDVWVHLVGIASVLLAAIGTVVAFRVWSGARNSVNTSPAAQPNIPRSWTRVEFMGAIGTGMGAIFTLILLAQWLAAFAIGTCQ